MAYIKTNWENSPSETTPLNASNLNKIEEGIYQNSLKADQVGDLSNLETINKTSIVNAINELKDAEIYSTNEIKTNKVWIDGKPIYRRIYQKTSTAATENIDIDDWNVDFVCLFVPLLYDSINRQFDTNYYISSTDYLRALTRLYNNKFTITVQRGNANSKVLTIIMEYTKTTD